MPSNTVAPAEAAPADRAPRQPRAPGQGAPMQPDFEAALRRVGARGRGIGDEHEAAPDAAAPPPLFQALAPPLSPVPPQAAPIAAWAPQSPRPADALTKHLQALSLPAAPAVDGSWRVQMLDRSLPVQQVDVQRSAAGGLQVVIQGAAGAPPEAARAVPLERLRQRLAARGTGTTSLVYRQPPEQEP